MQPLAVLCSLLLGASLLSAAEPQGLDYYLPDGAPKDSSITTPKAFLGYEVGEWHLRHDQLIQYLRLLSEESPRLAFEEIGRTHEHRSLVMITVTSPANHARLDDIQKQHLQLGDPASNAVPDERWPVVVNMGYSVHGDESSGANAVPLLAYYLAAARGSEISRLLDNAVILIDPCLNPDGFSRFAQWANSHRGRQLVPHDEHREHHAVWPGGRTNHYWFDLNRDWLLAQHPESQARLAKFHQWYPNVLTDFHEMGSKSTYFFQPGVPERKHPLTPIENVTLTQTFAEGHAAALDRIRSLYYTQERFDDFYYGKGSTYPDIHGGVGILFEQASSRGHLRESPHGEFDFSFTIRNHVRTSLSTLKAAVQERVSLLRYQQGFYRDALALAKAEPLSGYVFGETRDASRLREMLALLRRHGIQIHQLGKSVTLDGQAFEPASSYVVPLAQPQYRLVKALFETRTEFEDDIFYDVSTWTLPLAFGIPYAEAKSVGDDWLGSEVSGESEEPSSVTKLEEAYAYAIEWDDYFAPKVLYQLQKSSIRVAVSTAPLHLHLSDGERSFSRGTLLIPASRQKLSPADCAKAITKITSSEQLQVHTIGTGLTSQGVDLGSNRIRVLESVRPALLVGSGVSHYEAGEVWHLLDHRMGITLPLLETKDLGKLDLERYTHLILVDGSYAAWEKDEIEALKRWIKRGGILVTQKRASQWAAEKGLLNARFWKKEKPGNPKPGAEEHAHHHKKSESPEAKEDAKAPAAPLVYGDYHSNEDAKRTSGAIFQGRLDLTHPLAYGYRSEAVAMFRNSNLVMYPSKDPYATPLRYTENPLISGYVHAENLDRFRNQAGIVAEKSGKGAIIAFVDNPNFRAFWYGTNKLFLNALFFGQILEATESKAHDDASAAQDHHH